MSLEMLGNISDLMTGKETSINSIDINSIKPDPNQPRKHFDEELLQELAESIAVNGLIQPINVRENPNGDGYIINCGERRYQACLLIGKEEILAVVDNDFKDIGQLIENVSRVDLSLLERADFIQRLIEQGLTQKEIAEQLGHKDTSWVSRHATVAKAPAIIKTAINEGKIDSLEVAQTLTSKIHSDTDGQWYNCICEFLEQLPNDQKITTTLLRSFIAEAKEYIESSDEANESSSDSEASKSSSSDNTNNFEKKFKCLSDIDSKSIPIIDEIATNEELLMHLEILDTKVRKAFFDLLLEMNDDFTSEQFIQEWQRLTNRN